MRFKSTRIGSNINRIYERMASWRGRDLEEPKPHAIEVIEVPDYSPAIMNAAKKYGVDPKGVAESVDLQLRAKEAMDGILLGREPKELSDSEMENLLKNIDGKPAHVKMAIGAICRIRGMSGLRGNDDIVGNRAKIEDVNVALATILDGRNPGNLSANEISTLAKMSRIEKDHVRRIALHLIILCTGNDDAINDLDRVPEVPADKN